jgi:hypothetical protein
VTTEAMVFVSPVSMVTHIAVEFSQMIIYMRVEPHFFRPLGQFFIRTVTTQTLGHTDLCSRSHFLRLMAAVTVKPCFNVFIGTEYANSIKHLRCEYAEEKQRQQQPEHLRQHPSFSNHFHTPIPCS